MGRYRDYLASPTPKVPKRTRARYRQNKNDRSEINEQMQRDTEASSHTPANSQPEQDQDGIGNMELDFGDFYYLLEDIVMERDVEGGGCIMEDEDLQFHPGDTTASGDELLFPGSRMKVQELVLMLLTLSSSCHISGTTLKLVMRIIELVCPKENRCQKSMRAIFSFLEQLELPLRRHFYCTRCFLPKDEKQKQEMCTCGEKDTSYFIDIPMLGELRKILERLWNHTGYRFERGNHGNEEVMSDVYDGAVYQNLFRDPDGFLRNRNNVSLMGFVDGVSIFKSSGFSVWPVYLTINELPPHLRFRRENGVFAGLWFGKMKPQFNTFFKPFAETVWNLYENGLEVEVDGSRITVKAVLLQMTCDAPAKCLFQNFKQFNGKYGCPYCLHPGESVLHDGKSRSYIYDYRNGDDCVKRNHDDTVQHAHEALDNKVEGKSKFDVFGVKGLSWGMFLPNFDIIESICIDYMHSVLLGVVKQLMVLWFGSNNKGHAWSCFSSINTIQERLLSIKPTNNITRVPRSIEEMNHWKASEFRAWILFYGHVCMFNILPDVYYQHYLLLAESVWLLLQTSITEADINQADRNLQYFCYQIEHLYGKKTLTFNCHQLLHLTDNVRRHGPLWTHSCFYFEDCNGQLRHFFHGTQNVENQVLRTVSVIQSLPELVKKLDVGSEIENLYKALKGSRPKMRCVEEIENGLVAVGSQRLITIEQLPPQVAVNLADLFPHFDGIIHVFDRLLLNNQMIHSATYQRVEQRNSYTVEYLCNTDYKYGQIVTFYRLEGCFCNSTALQCYCGKPAQFFAAITPLSCLPLSFVSDDLTGLSMSHTKCVKRGNTEHIELVHVQCIHAKVLFADFDDSKDFSVVTKFPNLIEKD